MNRRHSALLRLGLSVVLATATAAVMAGATLAAPGPIAKFIFSPSPIAPSQSLSAGNVVDVTVTAEDASGSAIPNLVVYLGFTNVSSGGTASVGGTSLTSNPNTPATTDGSGQLIVVYTAGNAGGGKDTILIQNTVTNPTVKGSDVYRYFAGSYSFAPNPIARAGSLLGGQQVTGGSVCALDATHSPLPGATLYLAYSPALGSSGGSATAGSGATALTSMPGGFVADGGGCVPWSYTAPTTQPSVGSDAIVVQDAADHPGVIQTDRYFFGATYIPVTPPVRVLDTRQGLGIAKALGEGAGNSQSVQIAGGGGVPAGAVAVTGNLTVVRQKAAGYLSVTPTKPTATPATSNLNFPLGDIRANGVTAPLGPTGKLWITYIASPTTATTDVVLDITGYFAFTPYGSGLTYTPLANPGRVVDSRIGLGLATKLTSSIPASFQVAGVVGVPSTAVAVTGNLTVVGQTQAGYLSLTPTKPNGIPGTSTLNFPLGDIRANGVTIPLGSGKLWITYEANTSGTSNVVFDVTGYFDSSTSGLTFVPLLQPVRVADSRNGTGLLTPLTSSIPASFPVVGAGGIPNTATAVAGNLTAVNQTQPGYMSLTPTKPAGVPSTSTLNFPLKDNRANNADVALGSGNLWVTYEAQTRATTNVIFDVMGYFR